MMKLKTTMTMACMLGLGALVACGGDEEGTVDGAFEPATLEEQASITYNGFTLSAQTPQTVVGGAPFYIRQIRGSVVITGGSGTQKQGVCTLLQNALTCTSVTDCAGITVPSGGSRYCTNINNTGTKYCFTRQGAASSYCAGSPATGTAVGNGTYTTPWAIGALGSIWISYACVNGCASGFDPSVSSATGTL